jgi:hypothetical protein
MSWLTTMFSHDFFISAVCTVWDLLLLSPRTTTLFASLAFISHLGDVDEQGSGAAGKDKSHALPTHAACVETFSRDSTFIGSPGSFLTTGAWNNIDKLRAFSGPVLHHHGTDDLTVREALGRELFDAIGSADKTYVAVPGAAHGNFIAGVDDDVDRDVMRTWSECAHALEIVGNADEQRAARGRRLMGRPFAPRVPHRMPGPGTRRADARRRRGARPRAAPGSC